MVWASTKADPGSAAGIISREQSQMKPIAESSYLTAHSTGKV